MKNDFATLSSRLKYALKILKISQTELANRIGVKPQVIQYLCASQSQKSKFTCEIAEALKIDFSWLATGKGSAPENPELIKKENAIPILTFDEIKTWKINKEKLDFSKVQNWLTIDIASNEEMFAIEINDKSMAPRFDLKTIIVIDKIDTEKFDKNCFVLVYINEENFIIFRQIQIISDKKSLIAINKNLYKDIFLKDNDIIIGICKEARWSV